MQAFIDKHGEHVRLAARVNGVADADLVQRFMTVSAFLHDNPQLLSWRGAAKPDPTTPKGIRAIAPKYFGAYLKKDWPAPPTTVPDEAVSIVMQAVYGYNEDQTKRIKVEHQHSMSAENIVGALLERYIASVLEPHGWVWCAGDCVKAVDFIKWQPREGGWQAVQVKNRDNTENSSSAAIRNGTDIEKWFRSYCKRDATNWAAFPEPEFRNKLSEAGFRDFLRGYLRRPA